MFKLISHSLCPDDMYTKEVAVIEITLKDDSKQRFVYVRKDLKNGSMFWGPLSCSVMINGEKQHFKSPQFDSNFLEQDIKSFLNNMYEKKSQTQETPQVAPPPPKYEQTSFLEGCPF